MYQDGRGVAKDENRAVPLYRQAAAQGEKRSQQALKRLGLNW
jgi:TPR repeat protein